MNKKIILSLKLDGISIELRYKNGNFIPQQNRNGEIIEGGRELLERMWDD
jgi:NAD-dependent DNA ligase